ncbi:MAG: SLC13/DASS family transporter, partial [Gammaproteobacteria bacterium]
MTLKKFGLWLGVVSFVVMLVLPAPEGLSATGWRVAAVTVLIGCWWFTEAVPVTLPGSLPILTPPWRGIAKPDAIASLY